MIDIGVNLTARAFDADRDAVISRAREAGVDVLVITGTDVDHSREAAALAAAQPGVLFATAGIHPHHASDYSEPALNTLAELASEPSVVALGECGLDFNRDYSPRSDQERCFEAQLELAVALKLPVFLHQRDAHERFLAILSRYRAGLVDAVAHCFTGGAEEAAAYLDLDLHIGVTGWVCDERRGQALREAVEHIPDERLMLETDAPYLLPRDLPTPPKSRRNEPMFLPHICRAVARRRGQSEHTLAAATTGTASRFFALPGSETPPR
ncbi:MAG: TatD family hydrolase [Gammaproteobacteria bacterium]